MIGEKIKVPLNPQYREVRVLFETPSYFIADEQDDGWRGLYQRHPLKLITTWRVGTHGTPPRDSLVSVPMQFLLDLYAGGL